jgi:uridylate kinase
MKTIIISLGGSIIVDEKININFLKGFKKIIEKYNYRFVIVIGGGKTARNYIQASKKFKLNYYDEDLIGIQATRLNAEFVRAILNAKKILYEPKKVNQKIILSGGYKPGNSSDLVAVKFAEIYNSNEIINITKIGYVYNKDPKYSDAKKLKKLNWNEMQKLVGNKWIPGKNVPFDPIATKKAKLNKNKVIILNGLNNLDNYLKGNKFLGTIIK